MQTRRATHLLITFKALLVTLIASCVFSAAANAQATFVGKFTLSHEVHWGQAVLPAGDYSIRMDSKSAPAKISSASTRMVVFTPYPSLGDSESDGTYLTITTQGNEWRVHSLNAPALGKLVTFTPLTKGEREALAKAGQISTVPVIVARK
jgi:hypothetical protein